MQEKVKSTTGKVMRPFACNENEKSVLRWMADKFGEWDQRAAAFRKKRNEAVAEIKEDCQKIAAELKTQKELIGNDVEHIKAAGNEGWHEIKEGMHKAFSGMSESIDKAISKFKH